MQLVKKMGPEGTLACTQKLTLSQLNPVHILTPNFCEIYFYNQPYAYVS
jgi:hypothetical protein